MYCSGARLPVFESQLLPEQARLVTLGKLFKLTSYKILTGNSKCSVNVSPC